MEHKNFVKNTQKLKTTVNDLINKKVVNSNKIKIIQKWLTTAVITIKKKRK